MKTVSLLFLCVFLVSGAYSQDSIRCNVTIGTGYSSQLKGVHGFYFHPKRDYLPVGMYFEYQGDWYTVLGGSQNFYKYQFNGSNDRYEHNIYSRVKATEWNAYTIGVTYNVQPLMYLNAGLRHKETRYIWTRTEELWHYAWYSSQHSFQLEEYSRNDRDYIHHVDEVNALDLSVTEYFDFNLTFLEPILNIYPIEVIPSITLGASTDNNWKFLVGISISY